MVHDPIVDEVRKVRHAIEAECDNDGEKYYQHVLKVQEQFRDRLVRRQPKPALQKKTASTAG